MQCRCPLCGRKETLNRHSRLQVKPVEKNAGASQRGQRVFCSNRGRRGGCGRTFSIFLSAVLPRHSLRAPVFWNLLHKLLKGSSMKAAVGVACAQVFSLEGAYRIVRAMRRRLDGVRTLLCAKAPPPASVQPDPLLQTVEHLQYIFPENAPGAFQTCFQKPFLG